MLGYFEEYALAENGSLLHSGGLLPASLQRRQPLVNLIDREKLRVEIVAQPVLEFFILLVCRIIDGIQKVVEAGHAPQSSGGPCRLPARQAG